MDGKQKALETENIVTCASCKQMLWSMKFLSQMSSEWKSLNPELYPNKAPSNLTCPLCSKDFAKATKLGPQLRVIRNENVIWL